MGFPLFHFYSIKILRKLSEPEKTFENLSFINCKFSFHFMPRQFYGEFTLPKDFEMQISKIKSTFPFTLTYIKKNYLRLRRAKIDLRDFVFPMVLEAKKVFTKCLCV